MIIHWLITKNFSSFLILYKFITNFPPLYTKNNTSKIYLKFMQKIILNNYKWKLMKQFCKNFLIFLCLINYFYKNKIYLIKNSSFPELTIFILPITKTTFTLLKAPFVNKLAKKHYSIIRYKIILSIKYNFPKIIFFQQLKQLNVFINTILKIFVYFESNICYNYKITINSSFFFKKKL